MQISEIKWGNRTRTDYGDVSSLADSIKRLGLAHPIVLDEDNILRAGGRRLSALLLLEITSLEENIHYRYMRDLTSLEKKEIELAENIQRKDFTFAEEVAIKLELHELRQKINPNHKIEDTAKELGVSKSTLEKDLHLAKALEKRPELKKQKDKGTAASIIKRKTEELKRSHTIGKKEVPGSLQHGNCLDLMRAIPDKSIDLVILDPPYGVNIGDTENNSDAHLSFDDSKERALFLLENSLKEVTRVLKTGSHCYIFYAMWHHADIMRIAQKGIGGVQPNPAFWIKPNGGGNRMPFKRLTIVYEPFLFCWNFSSQKDLTRRCDNVFSFSTDVDKKHPTQKPVALFKTLIELSTFPGEVVLDPFAGSGNSLVAAKALGRKYIGMEEKEEFYTLMVENVMKGE